MKLFQHRSFENNKLDLTQVEGLSDMIAAETDKQRKQAWSLYKGEVSMLCHKWSQAILKVSIVMPLEHNLKYHF